MGQCAEEIEVGASFVTTIGVNSINNLKTFHVDDDLADYPDADFRNIQDAVNNASAYDSVIVHNGTYRETVTMDKVLSLVGEGRPTIDAKYVI